MNERLLETWDIHDRINAYLLESIDPKHLKDISASKGRTVGEQFAHMHNVRLLWLSVASPEIASKLKKIGKTEAAKKSLLMKSLKDSGRAMRNFMDEAFQRGRVKNFKPHPEAFLGYAISHESHHRGQILLALKQSGHAVDKKIQYGIWEWGAR
jgi:uncharacterized damage-inducible protein DinB